MSKDIKHTGVKTQPAGLRRVYEKYGAMLLGYLVETLSDKKLAEECLVQIFSDLSFHEYAAEHYTWLQVRHFAKNKLKQDGLIYENPCEAPAVTTQYGGWDGMTDEQKYVFYNAYNMGSPLILIAQKLNKPEAYIRKVLVEAFTKIRK